MPMWMSHVCAGNAARSNTFETIPPVCEVSFRMTPTPTKLSRKIDPYPFVPSGDRALAQRCEKIPDITGDGSCNAPETHRLPHGGGRAVRRTGFDAGFDRHGACVPDLRTGSVRYACGDDAMLWHNRSHYQNACRLAEAYGATLREIPIQKSVRQHFADIGHAESVHDVTYENAQARERTQVLMDLANQVGGIVIGTGDLSELALGWATYNGDHMSMYAVNASIPKTLVRYLVSYEASRAEDALALVLRDVLDTPVSPRAFAARRRRHDRTEDGGYRRAIHAP